MMSGGETRCPDKNHRSFGELACRLCAANERARLAFGGKPAEIPTCDVEFDPSRPGGYICNRERGHAGDHEAWAGGDMLCHRWPAAPSASPSVPTGEPTDSGTYGELPDALRAVIAGHEWDNMTRDEQRSWLIQRAELGAALRAALADLAAFRVSRFDFTLRIGLTAAWFSDNATSVEYTPTLRALSAALTRHREEGP